MMMMVMLPWVRLAFAWVTPTWLSHHIHRLIQLLTDGMSLLQC